MGKTAHPFGHPLAMDGERRGFQAQLRKSCIRPHMEEMRATKIEERSKPTAAVYSFGDVRTRRGRHAKSGQTRSIERKTMVCPS
jgi:hypothetical protein